LFLSCSQPSIGDSLNLLFALKLLDPIGLAPVLSFLSHLVLLLLNAPRSGAVLFCLLFYPILLFLSFNSRRFLLPLVFLSVDHFSSLSFKHWGARLSLGFLTPAAKFYDTVCVPLDVSGDYTQV
jgi:hypothetical protein